MFWPLTPPPGSHPHPSEHGRSRPRAPRLNCGVGVRPPPHAWRASEKDQGAQLGHHLRRRCPPTPRGLWGRGMGPGARQRAGGQPRQSPAQSRGLTTCGGWTFRTGEGSDVIFPAEGWEVLIWGPRVELR